MKKRIRIIGIIVTVLAAIITICFFVIRPVPKSIRNMVLENEEDYTKTALTYYENYQSQDADFDVLYYSEVKQVVSQQSEKYVMNCYPDSSRIFIINLNNEDGAVAMSICNSFLLDKYPLSGVAVYDGFVSFVNLNGCGSLVYSIDGTRPSYLKKPGEDYDRIWVRKITDNWYYVKGKKYKLIRYIQDHLEYWDFITNN